LKSFRSGLQQKRGKNRKENNDRNLLIIGVIGEIIIKKK